MAIIMVNSIHYKLISEIRGNLNTIAYKFVCKQIALQSTDPYEKALFGSICGELQAGKGVCDDWEDHLWLNINALIESTRTKLLMQFTPPKQVDAITIDYLCPQKSHQETLQSLYEMYAEDDPYRLFQTFIMLNQYSDLITYIATTPTSSKALFRFTAYFIILLRMCGVSTLHSNEYIVLESYLRTILATATFATIGFLCQSLDNVSQLKIYAEFLVKRTSSRKEIYAGLRECENCGIDNIKVASLATQILIDKEELFVIINTFMIILFIRNVILLATFLKNTNAKKDTLTY